MSEHRFRWWEWDALRPGGLQIVHPAGFEGADDDTLYTFPEFVDRRSRCGTITCPLWKQLQEQRFCSCGSAITWVEVAIGHLLPLGEAGESHIPLCPDMSTRWRRSANRAPAPSPYNHGEVIR